MDAVFARTREYWVGREGAAMMAERLSRMGLRVVGTTLGSVGVVAAPLSWLGPKVALHAIICLSAALAITYALDGDHR